MRRYNFNLVKPYCYFITRIKDSKFYFGVRYRNIKFNRSPKNDFAKFYFSSGRLKEEFEKNPSDFKYRLVCTFDTVKEAQKYEVKINKRLVKRKNSANIAAFPFINLEDKKAYNNLLKSRRSDEYREKLRKVNLGKKLSKESLEKRQKNRTYNPWSEERKQRMSQLLKGRKISLESREKLKSKLKGRKLSKEHIENLKKAWKKSKALGKRTQSEETRRKISIKLSSNHPMKGKFGKDNPNFGKKRKAGSGKNISKAKMGHSVSAATRKKISETLKKRFKK